MGDNPSHRQSSEHSVHSHLAGSRSTVPVRISHHEFPGDLAGRLSHLLRRIQIRIWADPEQQTHNVTLQLYRVTVQQC